MAPKRKADVKQQSLEETVEKPPTKVKTRGKEKEVVKEDIEQEDLVRAKMARKHGKGTCNVTLTEEVANPPPCTVYICKSAWV